MQISSGPFDHFLRKEMATYDVTDLLERIIAPTLIICGDDEMPGRVGGAEILRKRIPNSEIEVIPECGHWPMMEQPQDFFDAVEPFLRSA